MRSSSRGSAATAAASAFSVAARARGEADARRDRPSRGPRASGRASVELALRRRSPGARRSERTSHRRDEPTGERRAPHARSPAGRGRRAPRARTDPTRRAHAARAAPRPGARARGSRARCSSMARDVGVEIEEPAETRDDGAERRHVVRRGWSRGGALSPRRPDAPRAMPVAPSERERARGSDRPPPRSTPGMARAARNSSIADQSYGAAERQLQRRPPAPTSLSRRLLRRRSLGARP